MSEVAPAPDRPDRSDGADEGDSSGRRPLVTVYAAVVVGSFAVAPFAGFLFQNRDEVTTVGRLLIYAAATAAVGLGATVAIAAVARVSVDRVAVAVATFLACFFGFGIVFSAEPDPDRRIPQLLAWALLTLLLVAVAALYSRLAPVRTFLLVFGVVLAALPVGQYVAWRLFSDGSGPARTASDVVPDTPPEVEDPPNVYVFVLDEYARNDSLRSVLDFDNDAFYEALRDRGFVVEEDVHAPFQQTIMSLASVFDMDYIATTPEEAEGGSMAVVDRLRGESATVEYFDLLGYDYVYSPPGLYEWNRCVETIADLCIEPKSFGLYLSELDLSLLDLTPIGSFDFSRQAVTDPAYTMAQFAEHRDEVDEPFLLYGHVISPHWPYRWDANCELRDRFERPPLLLDKSEDDARDYLQDLRCLNERVLAGIDRIVESDPTAIVVVMSDHGSKFIPDGAKRLEEWRPDAIREELGVLYAMRVPERCRASVEEVTNSVNTFRVVTACIEGREPDLVEDRVFIWPHRGPGPQEVDDLSVLDPVEGGAAAHS